MVLEMEMSKTYQYRKVMKPMLERKRRARINKCLDELKDIMVECLTQEGEHITRLEKADILELTVEHMKKLKQQKQLKINNNQEQQKLTIAESFRAGYVHAANEVSKTLAAVPGVSVELGTQLMSHLGHRLNYLQVVIPTSITTNSTPSSGIPISIPPPSSSSAPASTLSTAYSNNMSSVHPFNNTLQTVAAGYFEETNSRSTPIIITPPPSECSSNISDRGSCSPIPSETGGNVWRPW